MAECNSRIAVTLTFRNHSDANLLYAVPFFGHPPDCDVVEVSEDGNPLKRAAMDPFRRDVLDRMGGGSVSGGEFLSQKDYSQGIRLSKLFLFDKPATRWFKFRVRFEVRGNRASVESKPVKIIIVTLGKNAAPKTESISAEGEATGWASITAK